VYRRSPKNSKKERIIPDWENKNKYLPEPERERKKGRKKETSKRKLDYTAVCRQQEIIKWKFMVLDVLYFPSSLLFGCKCCGAAEQLNQNTVKKYEEEI
jgi:hypothetical protein